MRINNTILLYIHRSVVYIYREREYILMNSLPWSPMLGWDHYVPFAGTWAATPGWIFDSKGKYVKSDLESSLLTVPFAGPKLYMLKQSDTWRVEVGSCKMSQLGCRARGFLLTCVAWKIFGHGLWGWGIYGLEGVGFDVRSSFRSYYLGLNPCTLNP